MSDGPGGFTDEQLLLMHQVYGIVDDALYSDALLALATVMAELLCAGAPSKEVALAFANSTGANLVSVVDSQYETIKDPIGEVTLQ